MEIEVNWVTLLFTGFLMQIKYYLFLVFAITCFVGALMIESGYRESNNDYQVRTHRFEEILTKYIDNLESYSDVILNNIGQNPPSLQIEKSLPKSDLYGFKGDGLKIFIYQNNKLVYWNTNQISIQAQEIAADKEIVNIKNGWYYIRQKQSGNHKLICLLLIYTDYKIENQFLINKYQPAFRNLANVIITRSRSELNSYPVFYKGNKYLCSMVYLENKEAIPLLIPILYIIGILFILLYLNNYLVNLQQSKKWLVYLILLLVIAVRVAMYVYKVPAGLYSLPMFEPSLFAASYSMRSLGDFFLSLLVLMFVIVYIYKDIISIRRTRIFSSVNSTTIITLISGTLLLCLYSAFIHYLQFNLVYNSKISLTVSNLYQLSYYSYFVMVMIALMMLTLFLLIDAFISTVVIKVKQMQTILLCVGGSLIAFYFFVNNFLPLDIWRNYYAGNFICLITCIVLLYALRMQRKRTISFAAVLVFLALFAFNTAVIVDEFYDKKEKEQRVLLAEKIAERKDPVAEYLFSDMATRVANDALLLSYFDQLLEIEQVDRNMLSTKISSRIVQQYFDDGYWQKYDIKCFAFDIKNEPIGKLENGLPADFGFFKNLIDKSTDTPFPNLFHVSNLITRTGYVAIFQLFDKEDDNALRGTVYTQITEKIANARIGFPQLLEKDVKWQGKQQLLKNYSWAFYKKGKLIDMNGTFAFSDDLVEITGKARRPEVKYFDNAGNSILYKNLSNDEVLLVHKTVKPRIIIFTESAYWFCFYLILFTVLWTIYRVLQGKIAFDINFKGRVQLTVVAIVLLSMALIGGFTVYFINSNYKSFQQVRILEKINSLRMVIQKNLASDSTTTYSDNMLQQLAYISNAFNCDYTIYDLKGNKIFSTKPTLFNLNIIGSVINRQAYNRLYVNSTTSFVQPEKIGRLEYMSSYTTLVDENNKPVAYLNLPFITDPEELANQISDFISSLINIYVPLFILCIILTFISANQLVRPLQTLQKSMSKLRLGKTSEPILWNKEDEIGVLINQYNKMVEELAQSADRLARSERESAWREMAKQVAHEIKNPLTPMKLSVQHLQRAWQDQNPNMSQIIQRLSVSLIEQIDTLSAIATEFSSFAKMPTAQFEVVNLNTILKTSTDLFAKESNVSMEYTEPENSQLMVFADKDQLIRVFTNLLKNAIQAIPENKQGVISVSVSGTNKDYIVAVQDNGSGIPVEKQSKIFVPYFTTKSFGTGLGLAMVKNIIQTANGNIWFETEENVGTIFYVQLPKFREYLAS